MLIAAIGPSTLRVISIESRRFLIVDPSELRGRSLRIHLHLRGFQMDLPSFPIKIRQAMPSLLARAARLQMLSGRCSRQNYSASLELREDLFLNRFERHAVTLPGISKGSGRGV